MNGERVYTQALKAFHMPFAVISLSALAMHVCYAECRIQSITQIAHRI